mgnify:CR=1 FL=1|tara:strand:- start:126 stop:497 length:372 start_codon:yes stop_codon:yes gene_type:complete
MPIDEPLLKHSFENKQHRKEVEEFGKKLLLPSPHILLATKLKSSISRDKEHKIQKDICDITALCLYSDLDLDNIIREAKSILDKEVLKKFSELDLSKETINCGNVLGIEQNIVKSVIDRIKKE